MVPLGRGTIVEGVLFRLMDYQASNYLATISNALLKSLPGPVM